MSIRLSSSATQRRGGSCAQRVRLVRPRRHTDVASNECRRGADAPPPRRAPLELGDIMTMAALTMIDSATPRPSTSSVRLLPFSFQDDSVSRSATGTGHGCSHAGSGHEWKVQDTPDGRSGERRHMLCADSALDDRCRVGVRAPHAVGRDCHEVLRPEVLQRYGVPDILLGGDQGHHIRGRRSRNALPRGLVGSHR